MGFACIDGDANWPPQETSEAIPIIVNVLEHMCDFLEGAGTPGLSANQVRSVSTATPTTSFNAAFSGGTPDLHAIVIRGGNELFYTDDAGVSWNQILDNVAVRYAAPGTLPAAFNALWPNSNVPTHALVIVEPREMWATRTSGGTWNQFGESQDEVAVVPLSTGSGTFNTFFSNNVPNTLAVVFEGNNIWVTDDDGGAWTKLDPLSDEDLRVTDGATWAILYAPTDAELLGEWGGGFIADHAMVVNNVTKRVYVSDDTGVTWTDVTAPGQRSNLFVVGNEAAGDTLTDVDYLFGSTNGTLTAIQDAITAALAAGGGTIKLRRGTYALTTGLTLDGDNVELVGEGDATILDGSITDILTIDNSTNGYINGVAVRSMKFDMNNIHGIVVNEYGGVLIEDVSFVFESAFDIQDAAILLTPTTALETVDEDLLMPVTVSRCRFTGFENLAVSYEGVFFKYISSSSAGSQNMAPQLLNCTGHNAFVFVYIQNNAGVKLDNCTFINENAAYPAAIFQTVGANARSFNVTNCYFDPTANNPIFEGTSTGDIVDSTITDNVFARGSFALKGLELKRIHYTGNKHGKDDVSFPFETIMDGTALRDSVVSGNTLYGDGLSASAMFDIQAGEVNDTTFSKNKAFNYAWSFLDALIINRVKFHKNIFETDTARYLVWLYPGTTSLSADITFEGNYCYGSGLFLTVVVGAPMKRVNIRGNLIISENTNPSNAAIHIARDTLQEITILANHIRTFASGISLLATNAAGNGGQNIRVRDNLIEFPASASTTNSRAFFFSRLRDFVLDLNGVESVNPLDLSAVYISNTDVNNDDEFHIAITNNVIKNCGNNNQIIEFDGLPVTGADLNPNFRDYVHIKGNELHAVGTAEHITHEVPIRKWEIADNKFFGGVRAIDFDGDQCHAVNNQAVGVGTGVGEEVFLLNTTATDNLVSFNNGSDATAIVDALAGSTGNQVLYNKGTVTDAGTNTVTGTY